MKPISVWVAEDKVCVAGRQHWPLFVLCRRLIPNQYPAILTDVLKQTGSLPHRLHYLSLSTKMKNTVVLFILLRQILLFDLVKQFWTLFLVSKCFALFLPFVRNGIRTSLATTCLSLSGKNLCPNAWLQKHMFYVYHTRESELPFLSERRHQCSLYWSPKMSSCVAPYTKLFCLDNSDGVGTSTLHKAITLYLGWSESTGDVNRTRA